MIQMDQKKLRKGCIITALIYIVLAVGYYFICGNQLHYGDSQTDMLTPASAVGEITKDCVVTQKIHPSGDCLTGVTLYGATYGRENKGQLHVDLYEAETLLESVIIDEASLADNAAFFAPFDIDLTGSDDLLLRITAPDAVAGNAITLYYGSSMQATRVEVETSIAEEDMVHINDEAQDGTLCMQLHTREYFWIGEHYWAVASVVFLVLCAYLITTVRKVQRHQDSLILRLISALTRYKYLIKQLVVRDFKTKYKRSVLGILWSFLNPLLTMTVQYIVFSTLFRSNIPNFVLYLLIGIVCFSFFNEATNLTLTSIVGNAALITKVYVPKYIYPLTRVLSSGINFLLALIPIFAVIVLTRTPIRPVVLLMPLGMISLFAVSLGIGMLLASSMVFFRDTQFLWGVLSMIWMYATPIFYPESILPAKFMPLFKCNPLYHIIRFIRIILMDGISPEPKAYLLMLIASILPLALGVLVFKKTQDRFVLNI